MHRKNDIHLCRAVFIFFKIFGLAPFNMNIYKENKITKIKFNYSKIDLIYNIVLSLILLPLNCVCIIDIFNDDKKINLVLGFVISIACCGEIFIQFILIVYCFKQNAMVIIANELIDLEYKLKMHLYRSHSLRSRKYIAISILLIYILYQIVYYIIIIIDTPNIYSFIIKIGPSITVFLLTSFVIQYILVLNFLENKFYYLNELLLSIKHLNQVQSQNVSIYVKNIMQNSTIKNDVFIIKNARRLLFEISNEISEVFGCPTLLTMTYLCIKLIFNTYTSGMFFTSMPPSVVTVNAVLVHVWRLFKDAFPLIIITTYGTKIDSEATRTGEIVHQVMTAYPTDMISIKHELRQFSIELLHQGKISFTACGFFAIDGGLFKSIISTTITYMIILLQYSQSKT